MNFYRIFCLLLLSTICGYAGEQPVQRELLIKWKDGPGSPSASAANNALGSTVIRNFWQIGWQQIRLREGFSLSQALQQYAALDHVESVEPNGLLASNFATPIASTNQVPEVEFSPIGESEKQTLSAFSTATLPDDPLFSTQWFLKKISATNAWHTTTGNTNIVVAVLDTGINYNHEDLAPNMWRNPGEIPGNGVDDDGNGYVDDVYGIDAASDERGNDSDPFDEGFYSGTNRIYHGTICAGLIGAAGNNAKGTAGVSWSVQLMAIRITRTDDLDMIADVIAGFDYVLLMNKRGINIRVCSNSYGANPRTAYSSALRDAIAAAGDAGILNVVGAANHGLNIDRVPLYPARLDSTGIIVVGASDRVDGLTSESNYGRTAVDLVAPGVDISSTYGPATTSYVSGSHGTSFAAPLVAGAAALLLGVNSDLSVEDIKAALLGSVDVIPALKGKVMTSGRLNVGRAVDYVKNTASVPFVVSVAPRGLRSHTNSNIDVSFNRAMNRSSVERAVVIEPALAGKFKWADNDRSFSFVHDAPFDTKTNYTIRILGTAEDDSGQTLDGSFNRTLEGSPSDDFLWNIYFAPQNDDFANRQQLIGPSGAVVGINQSASTEIGEPFHVLDDDPNHGRTLWYSWAPPYSGWFTFDLGSGTIFDPLLYIYAGGSLDQLVPITSNDNYGNRTASRLSFFAVEGTLYSVSVASKSAFNAAQAGALTLSWYPAPPPGFTGADSTPSTGTPGAKITLTGTNFTGATAVLFNGASASFTIAPTNNLDLRITAVVPPDATSGPITILTPHGNVTSTTVFQVLRPTIAVASSSPTELTLSWTGTNFVLQSSTELRTWTQLFPPGSSNAVISINRSPVFFRLRDP